MATEFRVGDTAFVEGSDNVFADLGLPDAEEYNAKAQLAYAIRRVIKARGLSQRAAAVQAGVKQPDLSNIVRGALDGFSMDRLTTILNNLDQDVDIQVRPKRGERARTSVSASSAGELPVLSMAASGRDT
jgi:predicted XRE-type DNA-binding protein